MMERSRPVARLAWYILVANLAIVLWGAWVRASGSGAGCGNHWPLCNGTILPQSPTVATLIEFMHRATSGIALLMVVILVIATRRAFPPGHRARKAAVASLILMCVEALIGAGLVLFKLVDQDASLTRGISLGVHLVNTQFLLMAIALTAWWADGHPGLAADRVRRCRRRFGLAFAGLILVGMAGAIASLGDTLFPARTLAEGMAQDRNPALSVLLHIRVWHPVLAVLVGLGVMLLANSILHHDDRNSVRHAARRVIVAICLQWALGALALVLLVPVPLQLMHLLTADLVWLSVVLLGVATTSHPERSEG